MFCTNCGTKFFEAGNFCHNCGRPVIYPGQSPAPIPGYPTPNFGFQSRPLTPTLFSPFETSSHDLLGGATWLPETIWTHPEYYYSFVNNQGKVIVARRAGFWVRFGAFLIDFLVLALELFFIIQVSKFFSPNSFFSQSGRPTINRSPTALQSFLILLEIYGYFFVMLGTTGQTLGKKAVRLKVIRLDGQKPDWLTAGLRVFLGFPLSGIVFLLGFLSIGWNSQKQAWHDKLARTLVVETRLLEEGRDFYLPRSGPSIPPPP